MQAAMYIHEVEDNEVFDTLYKGSAYTIQGVDDEWEDAERYEELLKEQGIGTPKRYYFFTGAQFNKYLGSEVFDNNIHFLSFPLEGLNVRKLAMFKLKMQDTWLNDIVDKK